MAKRIVVGPGASIDQVHNAARQNAPKSDRRVPFSKGGKATSGGVSQVSVPSAAPSAATDGLAVGYATPQDVTTADGATAGTSSDAAAVDHVHEIPDFAGDVTGAFNDTTVVAMQGHPWSSGTPNSGNVVYYDGLNSRISYMWPAIIEVCTVIADTNQTLSGMPFIDGVGTSGGSIILCINQTDARENGIWKQNGAGAWYRPPQWYTGSSYPDGLTVYCKSGTRYGYTFYTQLGDCSSVDTDPSGWVPGPGNAFGPAGTGARRGAVPKPSGSVHSPAWLLGDNGTWIDPSTIVSGGTTVVRGSTTVTSSSLAAGASDTSHTLTGAKTAFVYKGSTTYPARVRIYSTSAARTADLSRPIGFPPTPYSGFLAELITAAGTLSFNYTPTGRMLFNLDGSVAATVYMTITNLDSVTRTIGVTLVTLPLEA